MNLLNSPSIRLLEQSLDASSLRQKVTANNIANVDTPRFKRSDVRFEDLLQQEMGTMSFEGIRTDPRHFTIGTSGSNPAPQIVPDDKTVMFNNLNNVDIDSEMALMAKNQLRYNVMVQQMNQEIRHLRTAIEGRRP